MNANANVKAEKPQILTPPLYFEPIRDFRFVCPSCGELLSWISLDRTSGAKRGLPALGDAWTEQVERVGLECDLDRLEVLQFSGSCPICARGLATYAVGQWSREVIGVERPETLQRGLYGAGFLSWCRWSGVVGARLVIRDHLSPVPTENLNDVWESLRVILPFLPSPDDIG